MNWHGKWQAFSEGLHEFYHAPYRKILTQAYRDERDLFMLMIFAESLGIPNPMTFYTMELQPLLMEEFHEWHMRMQIPRSPLERFGCC